MSRRLLVIASVIAMAPILWNAWSAGRDGWVPEGDSATLTIRTHDVFTADPPLLGNPTSVGLTGGPEVFHPGPLQFYAMAVPLRALGPDGAGMLLGAALVNATAVLAIGWFARRSGGTALALWLSATSAVLVWALGDELVHDIYNPHITLLPMALLAVLVWAAGCGDRMALPAAVTTASFAAQAHAYYALLAGLLALAVLVAAVLGARPDRRGWVVSIVLGLVLWLPVLLAEVGPGPSNLVGLLRVGAGEVSGAEGEVGPPVGFGFALGRLADTVLGAQWLDPAPSAVDLLGRPGVLPKLLVVALLAGLGALGVRAGRRGRRPVALLVAAALTTAAAAVLVTARLGTGVPLLEPHSHRHWWITGWLVWTAGAWALADLARGHLLRVPRRVVLGLVAVPLALGSVAAAWAPSIRDDRGSVNFNGIRHLTDEIADALPGGGPWLVRAEGEQAYLSVQAGLVAGLLQRGVEVRVPVDRSIAMGAHRVASADDPVAGTILVASGEEPPEVPTGFVLVARFDAVADAQRTGHRNAGFVDHPQQLAVFVAVGEPATSGEG